MPKHHYNQKAMNTIHIRIEVSHIQRRKKIVVIGLYIFQPFVKKKLCNIYSNTETLVHLLKGSLGTGILAMPKAFHQAGYLSGFINTILIGILCTYGLHILVSSIFLNSYQNKSITIYEFQST